MVFINAPAVNIQAQTGPMLTSIGRVTPAGMTTCAAIAVEGSRGLAQWPGMNRHVQVVRIGTGGGESSSGLQLLPPPCWPLSLLGASHGGEHSHRSSGPSGSSQPVSLTWQPVSLTCTWQSVCLTWRWQSVSLSQPLPSLLQCNFALWTTLPQ